jgi:hypothetical protein
VDRGPVGRPAISSLERKSAQAYDTYNMAHLGSVIGPGGKHFVLLSLRTVEITLQVAPAEPDYRKTGKPCQAAASNAGIVAQTVKFHLISPGPKM